MSDDIARRKSPSVHMVIVATVVVAVMLAVPFVAAVDSSAYTDGKAGYSVKVNGNATDAELTAVGLSKEIMLRSIGLPFEFANAVHNSTASDVSIGSFSYNMAYGATVSGKTETTIIVEKYTYSSLSVTYTMTSPFELFGDYDDYGEKEKAAADAVIAYFGTSVAEVGSRIVVTGDCEGKMAIKSITEFTDVNQTQCVAKSYSGGDAVAQDSTLTITYIPAGSTEGKTITSSVSGKGTETSEIECRYQKDYSELKDGDEFTRVTKTSADIVDNSSSLTVGDKEYDIADDVDDKEKSSTGYVWLRSIDDIKAVQSEFPKYKSSENVTAELSYEAAESMYNDVYDSISSKKSNTMLYVGIGAGIGVVVIAGIVVFVLLRRRA